ncbi:MAG: gluconokinase [Opitutales bacterium]
MDFILEAGRTGVFHPAIVPPAPSRLVLVMGVAGSGKTTVGRQLAQELGWPYFEADDLHPAANKAKMARSEPLNDADRAPWLAAIRTEMDACRARGQSAVFTCSALKAAYRHTLLDGAPPVDLVHLHGDYATILQRVGRRQEHFMPAELVRSQFETLEHPAAGALSLDTGNQSPTDLVAAIRRHYAL